MTPSIVLACGGDVRRSTAFSLPGAVILLGDFLFAQSAMLAAATNSPRVVSIFASTLADICDGQLREMFFAHRLDQSREEYERRIFGKTASLFAGSAEMGAILGDAPETAVQALRQYGSDVGMAFQIVDDVLDLREGASQLGKPAGQDLTQGTVTLPTIIYASGLTEGSEAATRLDAVVSGEIVEPSEVDRVVEEIRGSGALEAAMEEAIRFAARSKTHVAAASDPETRDMLEQDRRHRMRTVRVAGIRIPTLPRGQSRTSGQKCCASSVRVGQPSPGRPRAAPACRAS